MLPTPLLWRGGGRLYDIHGNVDTLLHDYGAAGTMADNGSRYKRITYGYDLISGKVNSVSYQPRLYDPLTKTYITQPDAFYPPPRRKRLACAYLTKASACNTTETTTRRY